MSATAATARYIITADDKTKAAIASVNAGFKHMERGIKSTVSRMNAGFALLAGAGIARTFQNVFKETAKGSKEFSTALDDVRRSARGLLAAKDGVPGATAAMQELAETLKDPAVVAAADAITSALITGFAKVTQFVSQSTVGIQVLLGMTGDEVENLRRQIDDIDRRIALAKSRRLPTDALEAQRGRLASRQMSAIERGSPRQPASNWVPDSVLDVAADKATSAFNVTAERKSRIDAVNESLKESFAYIQKLKDYPLDEWLADLQADSEAARRKMKTSFFDQMDEGAKNVDVSLKSVGYGIDEFSGQVDVAIGKMDEWSVAADQAARNIQTAFADFLFDPFSDGLKGMLKGFIDVTRRMGAEAAAAKIFGSKASGGFGVGDFISGLFGMIGGTSGSSGAGGGGKTGSGPQMATGTNFVPYDNFPAMLHRGEAVVPAKYNPAAGGAAVYNLTTNINVAAGAVITRAEAYAIGKSSVDAAVARIKDERRRGKL